MKTVDRMTSWEILGLEPGASPAEIRQAYDRLNARLAPGSLALYSLAERDEQAALQRKLRLAFLELIGDALDPRAAEAAPPPPRVEEPPAPAPTTTDAGPDTAPGHDAVPDGGFDGAAVRRAREAKGISLDVLSHRTRIRKALLEALEEERFAELPARVFVRGFVFAIAAQIGLDPEKVWAGYGQRWEAWSARRTGP